jgi:hypothetical protein
MLHPNQVAIDYIWKRFVETTISETFCDGRSRKHSKKPVTQAFNPNSESHLKFESKGEKITTESIFIHEILVMLKRILIAVGVIVGIFYCLNIAILKKMR